ncbi:hypothetical protein ACOSQ2_008896 [Xanthoceras sorbifolium]
MANGMASFQVPTLKNENYDNWSIKMKAFLGAHDVWEVIEKGYTELEDESTLSQTQKDSLKDSRKRDKKALYVTSRISGDEFLIYMKYVKIKFYYLRGCKCN